MIKDNITKKYMSDNNIFADIFNYYIYDGKDVIDPNNLTELDSISLVKLKNKSKIYTIDKRRDILKCLSVKKSNNTKYVLLGIEGQSYIDNAMVVRNMLYDSITYFNQVEYIEKMNKDAKIKLKDRYLSKLNREDKLSPVITLVIYFGSDEWDAPNELYELLDTKDNILLKYVNNYKLNVISPYKMNDLDFNKFKSEMKLVLKFIKNSNYKVNLKNNIIKDKSYENVSTDTVDVINVLTNSKIKYNDKEGMVNMCKGLDDLINDGKEEGKAEGKAEKEIEIIKTMNSNGLTPEFIAKSLNLDINYVNKILQ